jgi:hypothetical protein
MILLPGTEIEQLVRRGVEVLGAASVGALRAFGLRDRGVTGFGWVYNAYCTGRIAAMDEIAPVCDLMSHRPLTVPLVNIRVCLDPLVDRRRVGRSRESRCNEQPEEHESRRSDE